MSYKTHLHCDPRYKDVSTELAVVATTTLAYEQATPGEVTIVLTDEVEIQNLNRRFAGRDEPTDVLSFADHSRDIETGDIYYGDVVIAVPVAKVQAESTGHSLEAELALLTIHGVLHLLSYDHAQSKERQRMWATQSAIMSNLGYTISLPEERI